MNGYDAIAGVAVSLVTAIVGQIGGLSGGLRQLIVVVLSAAVALALAGAKFTLQDYLTALVAVFAVANAAQAAVKYTARAVKPEEVASQ